MSDDLRIKRERILLTKIEERDCRISELEKIYDEVHYRGPWNHEILCGMDVQIVKSTFKKEKVSCRKCLEIINNWGADKKTLTASVEKMEKFKESMVSPFIGSYVIKMAKSVLVCCKCHSQVMVSGFNENKLPIYKCNKDTCPSFGRERNYQQREWLEYQQAFTYPKEKVI